MTTSRIATRIIRRTAKISTVSDIEVFEPGATSPRLRFDSFTICQLFVFYKNIYRLPMYAKRTAPRMAPGYSPFC